MKKLDKSDRFEQQIDLLPINQLAATRTAAVSDHAALSIGTVLQACLQYQILPNNETYNKTLLIEALSIVFAALSIGALASNPFNITVHGQLQLSRYFLSNLIFDYSICHQAIDDLTRRTLPQTRWELSHHPERSPQKQSQLKKKNAFRLFMIAYSALCVSLYACIHSSGLSLLYVPTMLMFYYVSGIPNLYNDLRALISYTQKDQYDKYHFAHALHAFADHIVKQEHLDPAFYQAIQDQNPSTFNSHQLLSLFEQYLQAHPELQLHRHWEGLDYLFKPAIALLGLAFSGIACVGVFAGIASGINLWLGTQALGYVLSVLPTTYLYIMLAKSVTKTMLLYAWEIPTILIRTESFDALPAYPGSHFMPWTKVGLRIFLYLIILGSSWGFLATSLLNPAITPFLSPITRFAFSGIATFASTLMLLDNGDKTINRILVAIAKKYDTPETNLKLRLHEALVNASDVFANQMSSDEFHHAKESLQEHYPTVYARFLNKPLTRPENQQPAEEAQQGDVVELLNKPDQDTGNYYQTHIDQLNDRKHRNYFW